MDPVQNQFSSGDTQQPPNPVQPVTPVQSAQPVQQAQPVQSVQQSASSAQVVQPVSMGTGDIILNSTAKKRDRKKMFVIVLAVVFCVVAIVLLVFSLRESMDGDEVTASNAREAYNIFANYFLTGDVSKQDIKIEVSGILSEENETNDLEETEMESSQNVIEVGGSGYFDQEMNSNADTLDDYVNNLKRYYDNFQNLYLEEIGIKDADDGNEDSDVDYDSEIEQYFDDYKNQLNLVLTYYGKGNLTFSEILTAYANNGELEVEELVKNASEAYLGLDETYGIRYGGLLRNYGEQNIALIKMYNDFGCLKGGDVDYNCAIEHSTDEMKRISDAIGKYNHDMFEIFESCNKEVHSVLYVFADMVYGEEEVSQNDEE